MAADKQKQPRLMLASSSPYRRELLTKLGLAFDHASPSIDETPLANEVPEDLVVRLAIAKAEKLAPVAPNQLIIGSDQVAVGPDAKPLGKPHNRDRAIAQLAAMSGKTVTFMTGLCLLDSATGQRQTCCEPFQVKFRALSQAQIARYVDAEKPLDCAGSFKSEGLGITLFESLEGRDPNALVGLPLLALVGMLAQVGVVLP